MRSNPIIEEIREIRRKIDTEIKSDPAAYYKRIIRLQEKHKEHLIAPGALRDRKKQA